jgi:pyroglutamyl-peptidase
MIHVGVSKSDTQISLEKQTFNLDYHANDMSNSCPEGQCCVRDAPDVLHTGLNVERLCVKANERLRRDQCVGKCGESTDPGRYLCAYTYYLSLHQDTAKALFVHVPDQSVCPVRDMSVALRSIILDSLNQLYEANFEV